MSDGYEDVRPVVLRAMFMDPVTPADEAKWWAREEIKRLQAQHHAALELVRIDGPTYVEARLIREALEQEG